MLFNSFEFALFLSIVFILYWFVFRGLRTQNIFVVFVSYLFYGWWDWRFLILIAITTVASYASGLLIERYRNKEITFESNGQKQLNRPKIVAACNIILNLLILCVFKYFDFFGENLSRLFELFGFGLDWVTVEILLPVGISFYTFQALSYTIDVYKRKIEPTHDSVSFFAYVSFFPQLVAGPIERATNLLPQFYKKRTFDYAQAVNGTRQILWGLFKKIVVADNCATVANSVFDNYADASGSTLVVGALMFTFQIYGDFSGYSDIAIGVARLFGINFMQNFNFPYFSRDIAEFWRRWHISLTTWFRDYIYIPLGGSREGARKSFRNTMIIFLVSGFWHGASWTFLVWGAYHALLFVPLVLTGNNRKFLGAVANNRWFPSIKELGQMMLTFFLVAIGWIIFRAETITDAYNFILRMFSKSLFSLPVVGKYNFACSLLGILILLTFEWINRNGEFGLDYSHAKTKSYQRLFVYTSLVLAIIFLGSSGQNFIYFQF